MSFLRTTSVFVVVGCLMTGTVVAQLEILTNDNLQRVIFGESKTIAAIFRNPGDQALGGEIHTRLFQTTFTSAIQLMDMPWKKLQVLPHQTVLESAQFDFPNVRARTTFIIQWLDQSNFVLGNIVVLVYPTNLLRELKIMMGENAANLGLLDPGHEIKPVLKNSAVRFVDLEQAKLDDFSGKLAIVGPCRPDDPEWNGLADRIKQLAKKGTSVVWIQSLPRQPGKIWPSFYTVPENQSVVVVVQPELIADLAANPQSQLNLIYFCQLALNPRPPVLPDLSPDHEPQSL